MPRAARHNGTIDPPYPTALVRLLPEFLQRRRARFTYPLRLMEELGIDRPTLLGFVVGGLALQPDEGARLVDLFNPYATVFDTWNASAAEARGAGLVDDVGDRWHITPAGREVAARVRREADAHLATLEPIPAAETLRLAGLLARALAAIEASDVPRDHLARTRRFGGDRRIPMVALESAVFGLWQARDDCHMASWREGGFDGPTFDVLTRVWREEATTEDALAQRLAQQRPEDVGSALARLRREGLVEADRVAVTARGSETRQRVEDETDRRFFAPWPDDVGREAPWLRERLAAINAALAP